MIENMGLISKWGPCGHIEIAEVAKWLWLECKGKEIHSRMLKRFKNEILLLIKKENIEYVAVDYKWSHSKYKTEAFLRSDTF